MTKKYLFILAIILILVFIIFIHARLLGKVADGDAFYHLRHAWIYQTAGIFQTAFPWTQYSVVNQYSADIWYGFHLLLIPFTYLKDLALGLIIGPYFITFVSLLLAFFALWKLKVKWPIFWLFIFAFASADTLYRLTMLRPHPLSLGLSLLLFAFLTSRPPTSENKGLLPIFLVSAVFSWIHLSLSWLPVLILLIVLLLEVLQKQGIDWKKMAVVFGGLLLGWLIRPNPLGALKIAYIQVAQLLIEKQGDLPLRFGNELKPFVLENFVDQLIPITVLLVTGVAILIWKRNLLSVEKRGAVFGSLILTAIFCLLTFGVARRSNEIFMGFGIIFLALIFTYLWPSVAKKSWQYSLIILIAIAAFAVMPIKNIYRFDTYVTNAFEINRFKELSEWLTNNSQSQKIVFNIHWDRFAELFFWNQKNYYINGMDPIFQYAFRPDLYWKTHFFAIDAATRFTCGMIRCTAEEVENTPLVLKRDFQASYLMVEKRRSPKFYQYLETAPEFQKVFDNDTEALFKVL